MVTLKKIFLMQLFHNSIVACIGVADVGAPSATVVGACWQRIGDESRCSGLFQHNVTRAECCAGNQLHIGWTPYTIQTDLDYFQYVIVGKQASGCRPCKSTSPSYTVYTYKKVAAFSVFDYFSARCRLRSLMEA